MGNQVDVEDRERNGGREVVGEKGREEFCAVPCNKHEWPGGFVSTEQGKSFWLAN